MAKEYTELQLRAKEAGIASWHVKSDEVLQAEMAGENPAVARPEPSTSPVEAKEPVVAKEAKPEPEKVTFFWKDNRNKEFSIELRPATKDTPKQIRCFASKGSVLVLDEADPIEAKAIKYLRSKPDYKRTFDEVERRNAEVSDAGAMLDELMELDQKVLAQMVGGAVQDFRKTKGELITELQARK